MGTPVGVGLPQNFKNKNITVCLGVYNCSFAYFIAFAYLNNFTFLSSYV